MDTADGQIAYLVFEMKDGTLHLGDYIGDWLNRRQKKENFRSSLSYLQFHIIHHRHLN
jgi:hypothetical protein